MESKSITLEAKIENIPAVTEFIDGILEANDCPMKAQMQIDVVIDELFGNVANYAYGDKTGDVTVEAGYDDKKGEFSITFTDSGIPYDPLKKEDPDITLSADERQIGGLGIFLVKKTMDDIVYNYIDNKNVLMVIKKF